MDLGASNSPIDAEQDNTVEAEQGHGVQKPY
jgi:hypothetical protein